MILSAIVAMASNRVIGREGGLPWDIPEDMKFFKTKTTGHIILMGRKTFDSFNKPLPNRLHVVITRQKDYKPEGAHVFHTIEDALAFCRTQTPQWGEEVFLIGGGEIYRQMMDVTDRIYLTEIHREFEGDARFPEFDKSVFREVERSPRSEPIPFDFVIYERAHLSH